MDTIDQMTGEITETRSPKMPPEIAKAVFEVKRGIKQIGFDEKNEHSKYGYASIDKFYTSIRPLELEAGLEIILDEVGFEVRQGDSGKGWAFITYEVWLLHESGAMWGPLRRHLALPVTGAQTFGAAESYVHKAFRRGFFMVPTGEKDADELASSDSVPVARASRVTPAVAKTTVSKDVAIAIASRIRSEIKAARSTTDLNRTGIFGASAAADKDAILAQDGGEKVWKSFIDADAARRAELLAALPDDPIPDLAPERPERDYRI
jgi:hypothetical protein